MPGPTPDIADKIDAAIGATPSAPPALDGTIALGRRALRRRRIGYAVGAAATVLVIGGTAWAVSPGDSEPRTEDHGFAGDPAEPPSAEPPLADEPPDDRQWEGVPRDDLVEFATGETLLALDGATIVEQRPSPDVGDGFATERDTSAVAVVEVDGERWYVLARDLDGPAQYIAVSERDGGRDLEQFLDLARSRYAEGGGGLL